MVKETVCFLSRVCSKRQSGVGQELPWRGMGFWAVADIADSKMKQSRYLVMVVSPWCCWIVYESEVEKF